MSKTTIVDIHKIKGVRPPFDIYCGREVRFTEFTDSKWRNPFKLWEYNIPLECLIDYETYIRDKIAKFPTRYDLRELVGKRLGCWCITTNQITPLKCHCQILLKLIKEKGLE